jgi:hypothetical protein
LIEIARDVVGIASADHEEDGSVGPDKPPDRRVNSSMAACPNGSAQR